MRGNIVLGAEEKQHIVIHNKNIILKKIYVWQAERPSIYQSLCHLNERHMECVWYHLHVIAYLDRNAEEARKAHSCRVAAPEPLSAFTDVFDDFKPAGGSPGAGAEEPAEEEPAEVLASESASTEIVVDLNPSMPRQAPQSRVRDGISPCLVGSTKLFFMRRMRDACGHEALQLQGFPAHLVPDGFKNTDLFDLAGNAFNAMPLGAVCSGALGTMNVPAALAIRKALTAGFKGDISLQSPRLGEAIFIEKGEEESEDEGEEEEEEEDGFEADTIVISDLED